MLSIAMMHSILDFAPLLKNSLAQRRHFFDLLKRNETTQMK